MEFPTLKLVGVTILAFCIAAGIPVFAAEPLKVVASFSILGDLVSEVGGDRVEVRTLVGPNGDVGAIFLENISDPRLIEQIANETGIQAGGELYSDALSEPDGLAATYAAMMRHNANLLQNAMLGS